MSTRALWASASERLMPSGWSNVKHGRLVFLFYTTQQSSGLRRRQRRRACSNSLSQRGGGGTRGPARSPKPITPAQGVGSRAVGTALEQRHQRPSLAAPALRVRATPAPQRQPTPASRQGFGCCKRFPEPNTHPGPPGSLVLPPGAKRWGDTGGLRLLVVSSVLLF